MKIMDINNMLIVEAKFTLADSIGENYTAYHRFAVDPDDNTASDQILAALKEEYTLFVRLDDIVVSDPGSFIDGASLMPHDR